MSADPEKLSTDFKTKILRVSEGCLRGTTGTSKSFMTKKTLNIIEVSRRARLEGKTGQFRELKREEGKGAQVRGVCEGVEPLVVN